MTPAWFLQHAVRPALALLPAEMTSPAAAAMVIAICHQESRLHHRHQIGGPARGFAQFEFRGMQGVLAHPRSKQAAGDVMTALEYRTTPYGLHVALEHNDVLMAAFARLLLWTSALPLPAEQDADAGWRLYQDAWRPGKPRPETWDDAFAVGWTAVHEGMR